MSLSGALFSTTWSCKKLANKLLNPHFVNTNDFTEKDYNTQRYERFGFKNNNAGKLVSNNSLFERVGNGKQTSNKCGTFKGFYGCLRTDLHELITLDGENYHGKAFVKKVFHSCDKPSCPVCYRHGWAVRQASNMESRLNEFSKRFGSPEHIIISVPSGDYALTFEELNAKCVAVLKDRGVVGGSIVFHAERYRNPRDAQRKGVPNGWFFSPHYHVMGFIDGGYGRCRSCFKNTEDCLVCNGFKGRQRRAFLKEGGRFGVGGGASGYIVDVKGERKTVHGTCWYELHHCSIIKGQKKFQPVRWFGVCAKNRLKLKKEDKIKDVCPICGHDLVELQYVGTGDPLAEWWIKEFYDDLYDGKGNVKWIEKPKRGGCIE